MLCFPTWLQASNTFASSSQTTTYLQHTTSRISRLESVMVRSPLRTSHQSNHSLEYNMVSCWCQARSYLINVCMYHTVAYVLSNVILVSHDVLTNYSANPSSEVQPEHEFGSTLQLLPHPPPAPVVNCTCKIGVGCSLPLESTTRSIRSHLRGHGYVHKDRERASCPWKECGREMRWTNVARHIKEVHLGDRRPCRK